MTDPIFEPLVLLCPGCGRQHIDEDEWATKPHRTHLCSHCNHEWRPHEHATVGIPLGTLSKGWLDQVTAAHGKPAVDAIKAAWKNRERRPKPRPRVPATTYGGRT